MTPTISSFSPTNKKLSSIRNSVSEKFPQESPAGSVDRLRELNEKLDRSKYLHQSTLRDTSSRMADHNDKVCKTLSSQLSINEINENSKLISLLGKIDDLGKHRLKKNQRTEDKKNKKILKDNKIYSKVRVNQDDEEKKTMNRVDRLEKKQILQKNILMCQLDELQKEKEYKLVRQKLRGEDAKENLARSKKNYLKKRDKLLEKHLELNQKFLQMKEDK